MMDSLVGPTAVKHLLFINHASSVEFSYLNISDTPTMDHFLDSSTYTVLANTRPTMININFNILFSVRDKIITTHLLNVVDTTTL